MDPTLADLLMNYSSRSVISVYLYPLPSIQNQTSFPWQCFSQWLPSSQRGTADSEQFPEVNETPAFNQELNTVSPNALTSWKVEEPILSSHMEPVIVNRLPETPTYNQDLNTFAQNTFTFREVEEHILSSQIEPVLVNTHDIPKQYTFSYNIKEEDVLCPKPQPRSKIEKQTLVTIDLQ